MKKKLQLRKERLRSLSNNQLATIAGGLPAGDGSCDIDCGGLLIAELSDVCNMY